MLLIIIIENKVRSEDGKGLFGNSILQDFLNKLQLTYGSIMMMSTG